MLAPLAAIVSVRIGDDVEQRRLAAFDHGDGALQRRRQDPFGFSIGPSE